MSDITLSKAETKILIEAASREGGHLLFPDNMKPVTRQRMLGHLETAGLITASGDDPCLTPAGYRAIGVRAPRKKRPPATAEAPIDVRVPGEPFVPSDDAPCPKRPIKQELILKLLGRPGGATLAELIAATGWLPHTTRAALSRLRSAGHDVARSKR